MKTLPSAIRLIITAATFIILMTGCSKGCHFFTFSGPYKVSSDEQTLEYIPRESHKYWITYIEYRITELPDDGGPGIYTEKDRITSCDENGHWKGSWFDVWQEGRNIIVHITENTSEHHEREMAINYDTESILPFQINIRQFPYGQDPQE